jgi:SDR family mycofactocin-dependent oxidoreductase
LTVRSFEGSVVLVTGAAQGQGKSHVVRFAEAGADVIAIDVKSPSAADYASIMNVGQQTGRRILFRECDVRDGTQLAAVTAAAVADLGRLDIVVVNAGVMPKRRSLVDTQPEEWAEAIDINLTGAWNTCRAAVPHLIHAARGGSIILISSTLGIKGSGTAIHYAASKHGLVGLMKSLALHLGPHSIRVNSVHPTVVDTPMLHALAPADATREQFSQTLTAAHALPVPWVEPVDVSLAVMFLASEEARYITGVALPVDAGALLK